LFLQNVQKRNHLLRPVRQISKKLRNNRFSPSLCSFLEKLAKFIDDRFYELTKLKKNTQQLVRSIESCKLDLRRFGAKYTAGFYQPDDYAPNLDYFMPYPDKGSEIERHLQLMEFLGIPPQGNTLEFPITRQDVQEYDDLQLPDKKYVCIHPGSRGAWRQWPTAHFAAMADYAVECGFEAIITGTKDETGIVNEVIHYMKRPAINLAGKTNLGAIGILIKNAYALVSNCTGVSHMAAAFKTPSIVISMDGEPERWGPLNHVLHRTIDWTKTTNVDKVLLALQDLLRMSRYTNQFGNELPGIRT